MSKEYKNIDDLFKDKFEDFEVDPPEFIWNNVKAGISSDSAKGSGFNLNNGGIAGIALLVVTLGFLAFLLLNNSSVISEEAYNELNIQSENISAGLIAENQVEVGTENPPSELIASTESSPSGEPEENNHKKARSKEKSIEKKEKKQKKSIERSNNPKRNSTQFINPILPEYIPEERIAQQSLAVTPLGTNSISIPVSISSNKPVEIESSVSSQTIASSQSSEAINATIATEMVRGQEDPNLDESSRRGLKSDYGQKNLWAFGLYFTPEMIVYPNDDQLKNYSYSLDLHATFKPGNYFLQSGLGFARNQEQGNTMINYNQYLGSYEDVYNVTFDTTSGSAVPVYHTETVSVYDSINHVIVTPTKRYFTYLQIPLFVGYGEESKRFGWFVKGGPSLSFLLYEDQSSTGLSDMEARVLNVENELPARINTNWQFILTAGVTYKLGQKVSLSVEPMFRYYIKSVYEQDKLNTKHPYSIGLRTGLLLSF